MKNRTGAVADRMQLDVIAFSLAELVEFAGDISGATAVRVAGGWLVHGMLGI